MKKLSPLLLFFLIYSSCYSPYLFSDYPEHLEKPLFISIPMKAHENKVKVYFPGEKLPEDEYIKVDILEVTGGNRMKALIEALQEKGQKHGVDALIIMGNDTYEETVGEFVYTNQKVSALGIKFVKNIDYLEDCIKQANIIALDKTTNKYETAAIIATDVDGNFLDSKSGEAGYRDFLYNYSLQHLAFDYRRNWQFHEFKDGGHTKITRIRTPLNNPNNHLERVKIIKFGEYFKEIKLENKQRKKYSGKISFKYDKDKYLIEKKIKSKILGHYKQKFFYDDDGKILRIDVFKIEDEKEEFYFKAIFERYQQEELAQLIKEER